MQMHASERTIYLSNILREDALERWISQFQQPIRIEKIAVQTANQRVLAQPVFSKRSVPHYHAAAMDGICVRAEDTFGADENCPKLLKQKEQFEYIDTGQKVPDHFDSVIMIEYVHIYDDQTLEIRTPATPWQHIRPIGEDFQQGDLLFPQYHQLRPADLGMLLAGGILEVEVIARPFVTIIPTGNEIVSPSEEVEQGEIVEFNGTVFSAFIDEWGGQSDLSPIVKDDKNLLRAALLSAVEKSDLVIINAGSSAGSRDYTVHILKEIGEVFVHGIATRPGKPVILAKVNETLVVGLPGYPVSAYLGLEWFVKPFIEMYLQTRPKQKEKIVAKLGRRIVSDMGSEDFIRMNIGYINGEFIANPRSRFAGVIRSVTHSDGLLIVPVSCMGYEQGEKVEILLERTRKEIEEAYIVTGSHDICIDLLEVELNKQKKARHLISSHVGSMAGVMAIQKGEAHIAGIHLLDPVTGIYNDTYIKQFLSHMDIVRIPFLKRMQGWFLPKNADFHIETVQDIVKSARPFVNRQKGAGTRILFDLLLKENGILPSQIKGYNREMYTHIGVAVEVNATNGIGLGIKPAAYEMGCQFVPICEESYDWIMTQEFFESEKGQAWYELIQSDSVIQEIEKIPGYRIPRDLQVIHYPANTSVK